MSGELAQIVEVLERWGLLLEHDRTLPSVTALVAGAPIRGSWWGHKKGRAIFQTTRQLLAHPDALLCKLLSEKLTFVHRRLWPALFAVATAREPWQLDALPRGADRILAALDRAKTLRTGELDVPKDPFDRKKAIAELERRLLVHATSVHTERGHHEKAIETWETLAQTLAFEAGELPPDEGRRALEQACSALNQAFGARARLPWYP